MNNIRCLGSTSTNYSDVRGDNGNEWSDKSTARCDACGKRIGLYPWGPKYVSPDEWRLKTHYYKLTRVKP